MSNRRAQRNNTEAKRKEKKEKTERKGRGQEKASLYGSKSRGKIGSQRSMGRSNFERRWEGIPKSKGSIKW